MSRGMPSMVALLGLLAVAGYQNREKIAEMLGRLNQNKGAGGGADQGGSGDALGGLLGGATTGSVLSGGVSDLVDQFKKNGQGKAAESWVKDGPNEPIAPEQLENAIGPDILDQLAEQTGLSRKELLARLSQRLPEAVDRYTPQGRIPTVDEAARY
jgi:uncharacterized protein YidB (DUF937 family)